MQLCLCISQVSAFSTWEKELHKIVFDPRYLLLNSEERKQVSITSRIASDWQQTSPKLTVITE